MSQKKVISCRKGNVHTDAKSYISSYLNPVISGRSKIRFRPYALVGIYEKIYRVTFDTVYLYEFKSEIPRE